uniref:Uncharacterized protein n=1 Tax=Cacopsylla melanoneura TaxID=428564 RepID=A0A8D9AGI8_9HEMI
MDRSYGLAGHGPVAGLVHYAGLAWYAIAGRLGTILWACEPAGNRVTLNSTEDRNVILTIHIASSNTKDRDEATKNRLYQRFSTEREKLADKKCRKKRFC